MVGLAPLIAIVVVLDTCWPNQMIEILHVLRMVSILHAVDEVGILHHDEANV